MDVNYGALEVQPSASIRDRSSRSSIRRASSVTLRRIISNSGRSGESGSRLRRSETAARMGVRGCVARG